MNLELTAEEATNVAIQQAATRLGLEVADLVVDSLERREFPDASLGCPRPGEAYAQVITPGYVVLVRGGNRRLEYHVSALSRSAVMCNEQRITT